MSWGLAGSITAAIGLGTTPIGTLTTDLVEQMVGHRTRLAQEAPSRRHVDEDRLLMRYLKASERRDTSQLFLGNAVPQIWLLLGLGALGNIVVEPRGVGHSLGR